MRPIDPVVVREKQERLRRAENRTHLARKSLTALQWFGEYAMGSVTTYQGDGEGNAVTGTGVRQVSPSALVGEGGLGSKKLPALLVATSTSGVEAAADYVNAAFIEMRSAILTRAIEMAQADLDSAEGEEA